MKKSKFSASALIEKYCSTKSVISIILILAIFTFHVYLLDKYDSLIIKPILSTFNTSKITSITLIITGICTMILFFYWYKKKKLVDFSTSIFSLTFLVIYSINRFFSDIFLFAPDESLIKYSDYLMIPLSGILILKMRELLTYSSYPKYLDKPFLIDQPICDSNSDLLGRNRFAKKLSESIQSKPDQENTGSLAIGILGTWGSGKTSFVNMVLKDLPNKDRLIIRFNPWLSSSSEQIVNDFFNLLTYELSKYDSSISWQINNYVKTIVEVDKSKIISNIFLLAEDLNKQDLYEKVNKNLNNIKKQVIVFIDDLDRLNKQEIIEVLRIIRNTGNFKNITYIVAYDKKYVQEAIKSYNSHNYSNFLEKIFQFEFELPIYEFRETRQFLQINLSKKLDEKFHPQIDFILNKKNKAYDLTSKIILTHRDAIRFINAFCFEFDEIKNDVYLYDFYLIHLLKLKYSFVYNDLIEKWNLFFITDYENRKQAYLRLRKNSEKNLKDNDYELMMLVGLRNSSNNNNSLSDSFILFEYLIENQNYNNISNYEITVIQDLVEELLDFHKEVPESDNENYKMISYPKNFYKYFSLQLLYNEIPSQEFEIARIRKYDDYIKKLDEWINENLFSLIDKIFSVHNFNSKNEFENHVKALFKLGTYLLDTNRIDLFDFNYLSSKLKQKHKKNFYDPNQFESFFFSLFNSSSINFESSVIEYILKREHEFPIGFEKLSNLNLQYLKDYVSESNYLDDLSFLLYRRCLVKNSNYGGVTFNSEAKEVYNNFFKEKIKECELGRFITQNDFDSNYYYLKIENWGSYFESKEDFNSWIFNAQKFNKQSECYKEFIDFYEKSEGIKTIAYDFKYLTPNRWQVL